MSINLYAGGPGRLDLTADGATTTAVLERQLPRRAIEQAGWLS
jgi:hypothetical protein